MRSAESDPAVDFPSAGRAAILTAAIELVGRSGADATTVRAVARAAGVSPALVIHHFRSKEGLLAACDDEVRRIVIGAVETIVASPNEPSVQALLSLQSAGPALAYVGRSLQAGGEAGQWWFSTMMSMGREMYADMVAAGVARELDDPEMANLLLMAMDLGLVIMRPLVERHLGSDLTDPAVLERWARAEYDLLNHGVMVSQGPPAPPSGRVPAHQGDGTTHADHTDDETDDAAHDAETDDIETDGPTHADDVAGGARPPSAPNPTPDADDPRPGVRPHDATEAVT